MASPAVFCVLVVFICQILSSDAKNGFILTVPKTLTAGSASKLCMTSFGQGSKFINVSFIASKGGDMVQTLGDSYSPGTQQCTKFLPPPPGLYRLLVNDNTDILSDDVEVSVGRAGAVTVTQTDKPQYKPGQTVKFRVLTLLSDLKPRTDRINSIYIKDPNQIRVKQFMNVKTNGLVSLEFPLSTEAKLGAWSIEVDMPRESPESRHQPVATTFEVAEYVLPRFEVEISPPAYILKDQEVVEGKVCAKYTYGKKVAGYLALKLCWGYGEVCSHQVTEFDGCYNFTANMTELMLERYRGWGSRLQVTAEVTEEGTGAKVNATKLGPGITYQELNIEISDFTNGFFKPRLPYIGKVTVTLPDGSPAAGEEMTVTAKATGPRATDSHSRVAFAGNFTTDARGEFQYTLCEGFTDQTTAIEIEVRSLRLDDGAATPRRPNLYYGYYRTNAYRHIRQWFSPSYSYIQIPRVEDKMTCGQRLSQEIAFTTRAGKDTVFTYQVLSRGRLVTTGQVTAPSDGVHLPPSPGGECLEEIQLPSPPPRPRVIPNKKEEDITLVGEDGEEVPPPPPGAEVDEEIEVPPPRRGPEDDEEIEIPEPPILRPPMAIKEPVVRADVTMDRVASFRLDFEVTAVMSPRFELLVFTVLESGEVVADSVKVEVEPCTNNEVAMTFNTTSCLPGAPVGLSLSAAPGSVCGVGVVDKSVNILGGNHQVTLDKVLERLESARDIQLYRRFYYHKNEYCEKRIEKYVNENHPDMVEVDSRYWFYTSPFVDAMQAFQFSDFTVVTNLDLETRPCERQEPVLYSVARQGGNRGVPGMRSEVVDSQMPINSVDTKIGGSVSKAPRTEFPETWLWDIAVIDSSGQSQLSLTAPHTVTSWVGNALCVSAARGFGVSPLTSLTTFQPLFISLQLPYSAVRGERLPVTVTVYNYLNRCLKISLSLDTGDAFQSFTRQPQASCVCGGESRSDRFYVTPRAIGQLPLTAMAKVVPGECDNQLKADTSYYGYTDTVRRNMLVKAEGVTQQYTHSMYMCPEDNKAAMEEVELRLPEDVVKDSAIGQLRVIGDIMGPALTNLDSLVRMPTGCGEQNMVGFVPNIFVMKYLTNTNRLTPELKAKATKHMEVGYQRELNYRHKDGSYSAFGESDERGSVWLTAFVVKSFAQAQQFIYIDEKDMQLSIDFLKRSQLETGCFRETGKVFSSYMMGGLAKGKNKDTQTALTAYVTAALLTAGVQPESRAILEGVKCMNSKTKRELRRMDPYTMSLVAFANTLYDPKSKATASFLKLLDDMATRDGDYRYWQRQVAKPQPTASWFHYAAPSAEVEMTSYALLALVNVLGDQVVEENHDVAMWISQQRNPYGGFASTQDTIVGLNALSEFAERAFSSDPTHLSVDVEETWEQGDIFVSDLENTTLLLQTRKINNLPTTLHVKTTGTGCALVQAHVQYNKMPNKILPEGEKPSYYLRVRPNAYVHNPDRCDRRTLHVSVSARGNQKFAKGMSLVTIQMVTGWSPLEDSFTELKSKFPELGIKRHDYKEEDGTLTLYFEEIGRRAKKFRVHVEQHQELRVSAPKPANVKVFQYYETDVSLSRPYKLKTTCGTKLEIPRRPTFTPPPGVILQRRIGDRVRVMPQAAPEEVQARKAKCPYCPKSDAKKIPQNIKDIFCNSTSVYKSIAGRKGKFPIKLRQDFRPSTASKVNQFVRATLTNCNCQNIEAPKKRVFIFVKRGPTKKTLVLDETSTVLLSSKPLEREIRKLQRKACPISKPN